ncbi:MAG TPA: XamI family restriction endonuclease, partial [Chloroflexota bacterium]|nr:XamI family restriction endonuclease [Chloroflexota bacterium]
LNNDAAVKAVEWRRDFGQRNVAPAALLAGVYTLRSLESAQEQGLLIFWSHNLQALTEFIEATRPNP